MSEPRKVIYFPTGREAGCEDGLPVVMYIVSENETHACAVFTPEEVEAGILGDWLPKSRAMPYSEQAWHLCERYIERRAELDAEYKQLLALARKAAV